MNATLFGRAAAALSLISAGALGVGPAPSAYATGPLSGTEVTNSTQCTYGPVAAGLAFGAAHCIDVETWPEWNEDNSVDVAFRPATTSNTAIHTPEGTIPVQGYVKPAVGMQVYKSGRTSGLTNGTIYAVDWWGWHAQGLQVCSGDSGSPAFTYIGGQAFIVGMVTNGDGSVDEYGDPNHDKQCHNTDRQIDQYFADGPSIETMLAAASTTVPMTTLTCNGREPTQVGTGDDDVLIGTGGDDVIVALGGDDVIDGRGGLDTICGGGGTDIIFGGDGADFLSGGDGEDTVDGQAGNDEVRGGADDDQVHGGDGDDFVSGGDGNDQAFGGLGNDEVRGGSNQDSVYGGLGNDKVTGDDGDDLLYGNSGLDDLRGGAGDDYLDGGHGTDRANGDRGDDLCRSAERSNCER